MAHRRSMPRLFLLLVLFQAVWPAPAGARSSGTPPPLPGVCSESDRFGVWHPRDGIETYDVGRLHLGWYTTNGVDANPSHPAGLNFVQLIRLSDDGPFSDAACSLCPTWDALRTIAQLNPGSLWMVGNEPDRQDYLGATRYAQLYHDFYTFLKAEDPTCQVAIGGVVQPTPIRLQYLDLILAAYQDRYGELMPIDVWNVHNYVLREGATGWGCGLPPGTDPALALDYAIEDHDRVDYWIGHLVALRQWMADRGYRDRPLVVSEFGILMPEMYGYDYTRVREFMLATFDWMRTATDATTGYPSDGNRLVQAWIWWSLAESTFEGWPTWNHFFDPDTRQITALGRDLEAYTAPLTTPLAGTIDLQPVGLHHAYGPGGNGNSVTAALIADVYNGGAVAASNVVVRFERDGAAAGEAIIASVAAGQTASAGVVWTDLTPGQVLEITAIVDPGDETIECDPFNNRLTASTWVTGQWLYLPAVMKKW